MSYLKITQFTDSDIIFLKKYESVTEKVAKALDAIQGEKTAFLRCLLPLFASSLLILKRVKYINSTF
jgi:hypothetical protein